MKTKAEIHTTLLNNFSEKILGKANEEYDAQTLIDASSVLEIVTFLKQTPDYYFDYLACITAIDTKENIEIIYQLNSIALGHTCSLKTSIPRDLETCKINSISSIWKTAEWHEREIYDFFGVQFINHPDLRRILLPTDWVGHPLRKDYVEQESYHGIKVSSK